VIIYFNYNEVFSSQPLRSDAEERILLPIIYGFLPRPVDSCNVHHAALLLYVHVSNKDATLYWTIAFVTIKAREKPMLNVRYQESDKLGVKWATAWYHHAEVHPDSRDRSFQVRGKTSLLQRLLLLDPISKSSINIYFRRGECASILLSSLF
jgi:hypothetical protein